MTDKPTDQRKDESKDGAATEPVTETLDSSDLHATDVDLTKAQAAGDTDPVQIGERRGMFGPSTGTDTSGYGGLRTPILFPGGSEKPYGGYFDELTSTLESALDGAGATSWGAAVERVVVDRGELTLHIAREALPTVARTLRDDPALRFEICTGVSGVHYPDLTGRELHAVYHLLSITHNRRVRLEVSAPDADPTIPSVVGTWPAADWHERETFDMFGIVFEGHPSLTRILMPDDWPGHPQRKDYPLGGIPVEYKGGTVPPPDERRSYS
jgi:NADH-quinone oxidoreductase subunit C